MMYTKEVLTKLKEARKLTNKEIAADLGDREETTVQKWATGVNNIQSEDIGRFYKLYGIEPNEFYGVPTSNNNRKIRRLDEEFKNDDEIYDLVDEIIGYKPEDSERIMKYGETNDDSFILRKRRILKGTIKAVTDYLIKDYHMVIQALEFIKENVYTHSPDYIHYNEDAVESILDLKNEVVLKYKEEWIRYACIVCFSIIYEDTMENSTYFNYSDLRLTGGIYDLLDGVDLISSDNFVIDSLIRDVCKYVNNNWYTAKFEFNDDDIDIFYKKARKNIDDRIELYNKYHEPEETLLNEVDELYSIERLNHIKDYTQEKIRYKKCQKYSDKLRAAVEERLQKIKINKNMAICHIAQKAKDLKDDELYALIKEYFEKYEQYVFSENGDVEFAQLREKYPFEQIVSVYTHHYDIEDDEANESEQRIPTIDYIYDCVDVDELDAINEAIIQAHHTDTTKIEDKYLNSIKKAIDEQLEELRAISIDIQKNAV